MSTNQNTIKKTVRVTITKEIEVELMPSMFCDMTEADYLAEFRKGLWHVDSMDDVVKYAARVAAMGGIGGQHDGLGLVDMHFSTHPRVPDVKVNELYEESEEEIVQ